MINLKTIGVLIAVLLCCVPFLGLAVASAGLLLLGAVTAAQSTQKTQHVFEGAVPMAAATTIYGGTLVFINAAGYATGTYGAGFLFAGVAKRDYVNSGSAGALKCEVYEGGKFLLTGSGFTQAMVGRRAYATDNYTVTGSPAGAVYIGTFESYVSATQIWVQIDVSAPTFQAQVMIADATETTTNQVRPGVAVAYVDAVTTDANDFVVLPALTSVPFGFVVTVIAQASSNFEVRTPASSNEKINGEDSDGTKEYLVGNNTVHRFTKVDNTIGWMGQGFTNLGAVVAAVVPD